MSATFLGIDLGGTSVKAIALDGDGVERARGHHPFSLEEPMAFEHAVRRAVRDLEEKLGRPADGIGLSAPGLASDDGTRIAFMPGRFPGLVGLDWSAVLGRARVPVLNDAQAALLGESWLGAARGARHVLLLTLGTGVGGAAMIDGRLLRGRSGKAGHLGHVSLNPEGAIGITGIPGSLEDAIGNHNIRVRSEGRFSTTHALIEAHRTGDAFATRVWRQSVRSLAAAIASLTNVLDPECVVIGGGIAQCGDLLFQPLREQVHAWEWRVGADPVAIVPAQLGDLAGAVGAAFQARELHSAR